MASPTTSSASVAAKVRDAMNLSARRARRSDSATKRLIRPGCALPSAAPKRCGAAAASEPARLVLGQEESEPRGRLRDRFGGRDDQLRSDARARDRCGSPNPPTASASAAQSERLQPAAGKSRGISPLPYLRVRDPDARRDRRAHRRAPPLPAVGRAHPIQRRIASRSAIDRIERLRRSACPWRAPPGSAWRARAAPAGSRSGLFITSARARAEQRRRRRVVQDGELAGHVRLEGKLVQEPLAERVDRLDLQPARRLQRACKEPPRRRSSARVAGAALHVGDRRGAAPRRQRRPLAERAEDAAGHLRGGDLGEGQAEDRGRIGAGEQQADHALGQHMRLAGAGIGDHPGGCARVRRLRAGCARVRSKSAALMAAASSSSSLGRRPIRRCARDDRSRRHIGGRAWGSCCEGIPPRAARKWRPAP